MEENSDFKCPICLNIFNLPIVLLCGHTYCRKCLTDHINHSNKCPMCRSKISWGYPCFVLKNLCDRFLQNLNTF